jgi:hypothetical protein
MARISVDQLGDALQGEALAAVADRETLSVQRADRGA